MPRAKQKLAVHCRVTEGELCLKVVLLCIGRVRKPSVITSEMFLEKAMSFRCALALLIKTDLKAVQRIQ